MLGISSNIVGGCNRFDDDDDDVEVVDVLCAFRTSNTGTSMNTGESGAPLEKLTGVCIEDVDDSSSPGASSCGLETVGVVEGETKTEVVDGIVLVVVFDALPAALAKLRNMASIESALETLGRAGEPMRQRAGMPVGKPLIVLPISLPLVCIERRPKSVSARSELENESLPCVDDVLCGERISFVQGDGGIELARICMSVGRLRALELRVACFAKRDV
ncbi:hypothetical protein FF38_01534 [Lucilia cuprina]|uniref:Uncharacterized protein n=1 Tax=Lucilia cuprina TaxID=7375 RepID=A0A0L0CII8_LUCCU|nr:hypothetical protein FF38_01534 [Lucilia cuprina]